MTTSKIPLADTTLLHQFAQTRDPSAFQTLADRHINWIYSTALRLTQNPALAEDVTQGVLLALAQKAPKLARHPSLPAWLFRATRYGAHTLLRSERRRKRHEGAIMPPSPTAPDADTILDWSDLSPKLDAAVARLSTQDQQAILLRFYQQLTHPSIAATLNITEEAARKRVDRALARLRSHLNVTSPTTLATTLTTSLALAAPKHLSANLLAHATPHALAASKGITSLFLLSTLKTAAAITLLTLIPLTLTAAAVVHESQNPQPPAPIAAANPSLPPTTLSTSPAPADVFVGTILNEQGQPAPDIQVTFPDTTPLISTHTSSDGRFSLPLPKTPRQPTDIIAASADRLHQIYFDRRSNDTLLQNVRLTLQPARQIPITTLDANGQPVPNAKILIAVADLDDPLTDSQGKTTILLPANEPLQYILVLKPNVGTDYQLFRTPTDLRSDPYQLPPDFSGPLTFTLNGAHAITLHVVDEQGHPLAGASTYPWLIEKPKKGGQANLAFVFREVLQFTNADGTLQFDYIPADTVKGVQFLLSLDGYAAPERAFWKANGPDSLTVTMQKLIPITGIVKDSQGRPVPNASVRIGADSYQTDNFRQSQPLQTKSDGTFSLDVNPDEYYIFVAQQNHDLSPPAYRIIRRQSPEPIELRLQPGLHLFGQVTAGDDEHPIPPDYVYLDRRDHSYNSKPALDFPVGPTGRHTLCPFIHQSVKSDSQGNFEFYTIPGDYYVDTTIGSSRVNQDFILTENDAEKEVNLHADSASPIPTALHGKVVLATKADQGLPEIHLQGYPTDSSNENGFNLKAISDHQGNFEIRAAKSPMLLIAYSTDGTLAAQLLVKPTDDNITLPLAPAASLRGRLLDANGKPWPTQTLTVLSDYKYRRTSTIITGPNITTNPDGTFSYPALIPNQTYTLYLNQKNSHGIVAIYKLTDPITPTSPDPINLGDLSHPIPTTEP